MRSDFDSIRQPGGQIATLTEENKRLHDEAEVTDSLVLTLQEEVKILTKERDEARKEVERMRGQVAKIDSLIGQVQTIEERFAKLRNAPGMEEIDALRGDFTIEECDQLGLTTWMQRNKRLADIARRSIAARDEVVGLLKWINGLDMILDDGLHPIVSFSDSRFSNSEAYEVDHRNAKRILEIVGGGK